MYHGRYFRPKVLVPKVLLRVTHDIAHLTCVDFLRAPGLHTPVIVRSFTVIHESGSPESLRHHRGLQVGVFPDGTASFRRVFSNFVLIVC